MFPQTLGKKRCCLSAFYTHFVGGMVLSQDYIKLNNASNEKENGSTNILVSSCIDIPLQVSLDPMGRRTSTITRTFLGSTPASDLSTFHITSAAGADGFRKL